MLRKLQVNNGESMWWKPDCNPLQEPLDVLEPFGGPMLEPFKWNVQELPFLRFWSFMEIQHGMWPLTT